MSHKSEGVEGVEGVESNCLLGDTNVQAKCGEAFAPASASTSASTPAQIGEHNVLAIMPPCPTEMCFRPLYVINLYSHVNRASSLC